MVFNILSYIFIDRFIFHFICFKFMRIPKKVLVILLIQITEVLGFSLILPFLPIYAQELGASPLLIGLILTSFSFFQFFSAPIMGRLSDKYGRRPLLILSQISTMIGFLVLAYSNTLWMIFVSRAIDGIFGSNFTIAQAYLSDISTKKERSKYFGLSGVAFGIGFLIGPAIGGYLSQFGFALPSFVAAGLVFISIILTFVLLPETVKKDEQKDFKIKILDIGVFREYFANFKISIKLYQFFAYVFAHALWVSTFALYANRQLGMNTAQIGLSLAGVGLVSIILRGFLLPKLINIFGESKLIASGMASMALSLFLTAFIHDVWSFAALLMFFAYGSGLSRPLLMGAISRSVSSKEQGSILGVANSLGSFSQILGPLLGGFLLTTFFPGSLGIVASFLMMIGLVIFIWEKKRRLR
jgi:MFS transporter, DHA1 family, tetracycline resistance protein